MTTPDPQDYDYWHRALDGRRPPMQETNPRCGYYAQKITTGRLMSGATRWPVAIWRDANGSLIALRGFKGFTEQLNPLDIWLFIGGNAISEATYEEAFGLGRFPDDLPPEAYARPKAPAATSDGEARPNQPGGDTEELADQIQAAVATANEIVAENIADDARAAQAQAMRDRLLKLAGDADKHRTKEKEPFLEGGRAVDSKWMPWVNRARDAANEIRRRLNDYVNRKDREAREAQAAAARAAAEAGAQASQSAAGEPGTANAPLGAVPVPPAPTPVPEAPVRIKGGSGRAASVRSVNVAIVTDHSAFVAALLSGRFGAEVTEPFKSTLVKLAQTLIDAGVGEIPGVTVSQEKRVQ